METEVLIERIKSLSIDKLAEVETLVDSLAQPTIARNIDKRQARREAVAAFAAEFGGTELDLDEDFERAGIEHWLAMDKEGYEE